MMRTDGIEPIEPRKTSRFCGAFFVSWEKNMAKAIVLCYEDVDAGATANDLILLAKVVFTGTGVPNGIRPAPSSPAMSGRRLASQVTRN